MFIVVELAAAAAIVSSTQKKQNRWSTLENDCLKDGILKIGLLPARLAKFLEGKKVLRSQEDIRNKIRTQVTSHSIAVLL